MSKLILVKHSLPEISPDRPSGQWGLSTEGRRRCLALTGQLASLYPARIISSPEPCPLETAQRIAYKIGAPVMVNERLHAHRRPQSAHLSQDKFSESVQQLMRRPEKVCFGEETAAALQARFSSIVWRLVDQFPNQTLLIVTHGMLIALFAAAYVAEDPFTIWRRMDHPSYLVFRAPEMTLEEVALQPARPLMRQYA